MKKEFLVDRQGKTFVLYAGLLDEAHSQGLKSIRTKLLQIPTPENGQVAICSAEVETEKGTFTGLGDAAPDNVAKMLLTCTIRMAETRAKARALRDAVNVGVAALEELGDIAQDDAAREPGRAVDRQTGETRMPANNGKPAGARAEGQPTPGAKTAADLQPQPATDNQVNAIYKVGASRGMTTDQIDQVITDTFGHQPAKLTKALASRAIDWLKS